MDANNRLQFGPGGALAYFLGGAQVFAAVVAGVYAVVGDLLTFAVGKTLSVKPGANALSGTFTLIAGAATVATTAIDANTAIFCAIKTVGGTPGLAAPLITINPGTGFTVAAAATDTSTYNWVAAKVG